jgi:hypothetical protein
MLFERNGSLPRFEKTKSECGLQIGTMNGSATTR